MPPGLSFALKVAALLLFVITPIVWEAVCRLRAGPVRFRLAIASPADRSQVNATWSFVLIFFFWGPFGIPIFGDFSVTRLLMPMLWFWLCSAALLKLRRDSKRWLVLATGLLSLAYGAAVLVDAYRVIQAGERSSFGSPGRFMLVVSAVLFVIGAAASQEYVTGTRVRERGIEMFWRTYPWSRIVVKDWRACAGDFDVHLSVLAPRLLGTQVTRDGEAIVPVSASERPALEAFLAEHASTAG